MDRQPRQDHESAGAPWTMVRSQPRQDRGVAMGGGAVGQDGDVRIRAEDHVRDQAGPPADRRGDRPVKQRESGRGACRERDHAVVDRQPEEKRSEQRRAPGAGGPRLLPARRLRGDQDEPGRGDERRHEGGNPRDPLRDDETVREHATGAPSQQRKKTRATQHPHDRVEPRPAMARRGSGDVSGHGRDRGRSAAPPAEAMRDRSGSTGCRGSPRA